MSEQGVVFDQCLACSEFRKEIDRLCARVDELESLRQRAYAIVSTLLPDHPRVQEWLTDAVEF